MLHRSLKSTVLITGVLLLLELRFDSTTSRIAFQLVKSISRTQQGSNSSAVLTQAPGSSTSDTGQTSASPGVQAPVSPTSAASSCHMSRAQLRAVTPDDQGSFQMAGPHTYVYSAYYDARKADNMTLVKVIGVSALNASIYCHAWYPQVDEATAVQADIYVRKYYNKKIRYESVFILCAVSEVVPSWVVLSDHPCGPPRAILAVVDPRTHSLETNLTICLHKALYSHYGSVAQFVEWVEVHRLLGVQKFVVYVYNISAQVQHYIDYYVSMGIVEHRLWPLHPADALISQYKAQVAVINDCIYRYSYRTRFLALLDTDEILVPRASDTLLQLLDNSPCKHASSVAFRNVFFLPASYANITSSTPPPAGAHKLHLKTLTSFFRRNFSWPCPVRSKLVVRPERIFSSETHMTTGPHHDCCVATEWGQLHHYRKYIIDNSIRNVLSTDLSVWDINKEVKYDTSMETLVEDKRMLHFAQSIIEQVTRVYKDISAPDHM